MGLVFAWVRTWFFECGLCVGFFVPPALLDMLRSAVFAYAQHSKEPNKHICSVCSCPHYTRLIMTSEGDTMYIGHAVFVPMRLVGQTSLRD
jgi:hypothetical protein